MPKTVILANGAFPKKGGEPWRLLESARRVIACDGAANSFIRRFRRVPDFIIGDLDSLPSALQLQLQTPTLIPIPDQTTNDLSKAIAYCRKRGWSDLVIVGATGRREDHELGNIFRAMEAGVAVVTDYGRFVSIAKTLRIRVRKGTAISVFATDKRTKMSSNGLEWPLNAVNFTNLYCATLNRASSVEVTIKSSHPAFVYIAK